MKLCNSCNTVKQEIEFSKRAASNDGLSAKCKQCATGYSKGYYAEHADTIKARTAAWKDAHPQEIQAGKVRYRAKHRKDINRKGRVWYAEHRDEERARCAAYHAANPSIALERGRRWAINNPEQRRSAWTRRRGRVAGADGTHTGDDIKRLYGIQRGKCAVCKCSLLNGYHVDHIKPIAKGGSNWPRNLQLLCGLCNQRKSAKSPEAFMQELGYLL